MSNSPSPSVDVEVSPHANQPGAGFGVAEEDTRPRWRRFLGTVMWRFHDICFFVTYPFMVLLTVIGLFVVLAFCILPTVLLAMLVVCIYYCLMEDPVPLSVLLRYMLTSEDDTSYPNLYPTSHDRPTIQKKLIIRKLLKREELKDKTTATTTEQARKHPLPITIVTDHMHLEFSEPLVIKEEEDAEPKDSSSLAGAAADPMDVESGGIAMQPLEQVRTNLNCKSSEEDQKEAALELPAGSDDAVTETELASVLGDAVTETVHPSDPAPSLHKQDAPGHYCCNISVGGEDEDEAAKINKPEDDVNDDYFGISERRDRETTCDICLVDYEVGDFVAWSPNLECTHCFHKECVLDWLVRKNSCPSCRKDYLKGAKEDDDDE